MNYLVTSSLLFIALVVPAHAQQRSDKFYPQEKYLIESEVQRYQTLLHRAFRVSQSGDTYDVTCYKLNLRISTSPTHLQGEVTVSAFAKQDSLGSIFLDLNSPMTVDSAKIGGTATHFVQDAHSVSISLDRVYTMGERFTLDVYYEGIPRSTGFGSFVFDTARSPAWVWSLSEPYGAADWWPCKNYPSDKADSADIVVTCDSIFKVGSNGKLESVTNNGDGTSTWHWQERYPIASYLISVTLSNFSTFSNWFRYTATDSMEVLNYVLPEHLSQALAVLPHTVDMLAIYSNLFGLYPFIKEKYGHAEFGWGGGMEHQTMTSLSYYAFGENVVSHELAHQWFGDMITCRSWQNIWLNEGFAQYCSGLYLERKYGVSSYQGYISGQMYSAKYGIGTIYVQDTTDVNNIFNGPLIYAKGASVLHMLRHVLGDSTFFRAMYAYANDSSVKYGTATVADFQAVCENVAGKNLSYFFNEWIYGERYPRYTYSWSSRPSASSFVVTVKISQTTGTTNPLFFTMPMDVKLSAAAWDTVITVLNDSQAETFSFTVSQNPSAVILDPDGWILKDTSLVPVGVTVFPSLPAAFSLSQNYPNPFNPTTEFGVRIADFGFVSLKIYDVLGREVATLMKEVRQPGEYTVRWDASNLPSGVYVYRLKAIDLSDPRRSFTQARKMIFLR